jgi:zinc protease
VATNLWYHVGSRHEKPDRTGLAHLFEHMLFQGSQHVDTHGHFRHIQSVGGVANGSTWYDRTNYYETLPSHQLALALWLESDRMGFLLPALDEQKLNTQRDVVINERRQRIDNQPYGKATERLFELLFPPDHPYSWPIIGRIPDLEATTLSDVISFFETWYRPSNAVLTIAGSFDTEEARDLVSRYFEELPSGPAPVQPHFPLGPLTTPKQESVRERVNLSRIYVAYRLPRFGTPEWYQASLLAVALAAGKSSPLYHDLVYERELAQDVGAWVYPLEDVGLFLMVATAKPGVSPYQLLEELERHIQHCAKNPLAAADFQRAQKSVLHGLYQELERLDDRADRISLFATLFRKPELAFTEAEQYLSRSPEELQQLVACYLRPESSVSLLVLPESSS